MCIHNESVVPQFSLRDKRNDSEKAREIEKIFLDDLSLLCVRSLLLPKTAFEKKNRIFFFLILSCVRSTFRLSDGFFFFVVFSLLLLALRLLLL